MSRITLHPLFRQGALFNYDFAVIQLARPVDFPRLRWIRPACLPPPSQEDEDQLAGHRLEKKRPYTVQKVIKISNINTKGRGKRDSTRNIPRIISFSLLHFVLYLGKSLTFRTVYWKYSPVWTIFWRGNTFSYFISEFQWSGLWLGSDGCYQKVPVVQATGTSMLTSILCTVHNI